MGRPAKKKNRSSDAQSCAKIKVLIREKKKKKRGELNRYSQTSDMNRGAKRGNPSGGRKMGFRIEKGQKAGKDHTRAPRKGTKEKKGGVILNHHEGERGKEKSQTGKKIAEIRGGRKMGLFKKRRVRRGETRKTKKKGGWGI